MAKKKLNEEEIRALENSITRQIKAIDTNARLVKDAIYAERYHEARKWLNHVQDCAGDCGQLLGELIDGAK